MLYPVKMSGSNCRTKSAHFLQEKKYYTINELFKLYNIEEEVFSTVSD